MLSQKDPISIVLFARGTIFMFRNCKKILVLAINLFYWTSISLQSLKRSSGVLAFIYITISIFTSVQHMPSFRPVLSFLSPLPMPVDISDCKWVQTNCRWTRIFLCYYWRNEFVINLKITFFKNYKQISIKTADKDEIAHKLQTWLWFYDVVIAEKFL